MERETPSRLAIVTCCMPARCAARTVMRSCCSTRSRWRRSCSNLAASSRRVSSGAGAAPRVPTEGSRDMAGSLPQGSEALSRPQADPRAQRVGLTVPVSDVGRLVEAPPEAGPGSPAPSPQASLTRHAHPSHTSRGVGSAHGEVPPAVRPPSVPRLRRVRPHGHEGEALFTGLSAEGLADACGGARHRTVARGPRYVKLRVLRIAPPING